MTACSFRRSLLSTTVLIWVTRFSSRAIWACCSRSIVLISSSSARCLERWRRILYIDVRTLQWRRTNVVETYVCVLLSSNCLPHLRRCVAYTTWHYRRGAWNGGPRFWRWRRRWIPTAESRWLRRWAGPWFFLSFLCIGQNLLDPAFFHSDWLVVRVVDVVFRERSDWW